jgi:hypothetical protein
MSNENRDAFKLGFLARCAEEGLTGEKLAARLASVEKVAAGDGVGGALAALYGVPIGLGLLGGGAAGWGAAKLMEPRLSDDEIKAQELAHTYKVYADRIRARRKAKQYRPSF